MKRAFAIVTLLLAAWPANAEPPTADQIQGWVRDLDSPTFKVRDQAAAKLRQAGAEAAPALAKVAKTGGTEAADRALRILGDMAEGPDGKIEEAARRQLRRIADSESRAASDAKMILGRKRNLVLTQLLFAGAAYDEIDNEVRRIDLDHTRNLPSLMPLLKEIPELESLSLSSRGFADAEAKHLADLKNLRDLNLFESNIGDEGLKHITGLKYLNWLPMGHTKVTDAGLKIISGMTQLEYVGVRGDNITDAGLVHLKGLTELTALNLSETKVSDAGLKHLAPLTKLQSLYLPGTAVTDAGLEYLKDIKTLRDLYLAKTKTTATGRVRLREALPDLRFPDVE